jgi:hypothetical protein
VETIPGIRVSKPSVLVNLLQALLAIILGNIVYFLLLPSLPPAARHHPLRVDLGMVLDFGFCLVIYGAILRIVRKWR